MVDEKIEEFLSCFEEKIKHLPEDAFSTQVKLNLEKLFLELLNDWEDLITLIWRISDGFFSGQRTHSLLNLAPYSAILL